MTEDNIKGSEFLENALKTQGAIDAALRPPTFDDFTGQKKNHRSIENNGRCCSR